MIKQLLIFLLILSFSNSFAQKRESKPFIFGNIETIKSKQLNEVRTLNIYLPNGYSEDSAKTYPVIYLLDGSANEDFIHIAGLTQFLSMIDAMPESIVVGIANTDRRRDFTFPTTVKKDLKDFPTTGKSAEFISFIELELQPFIAHNYKTNASKTIIGQSLGGLLAVEILLTKPELFNNFMIISPSLWWDNESILAKPVKPIKQINHKTNVYISVGKEGDQMQNDAKNLARLLQKSSDDLTVFFALMPEENHQTILHNSAYQGFIKLFSSK